MSAASAPYRPDLSLRGKLRRRVVRLQHRQPAPRGPEGRGWVSFSFDDAPESALSDGAAILQRHGLPATFYICAGLAGTTGLLGRYADAAQVHAAAARGHEIGCHTFSHRDFGQASVAEAEAELDRNAQAFAAWGLPPATTFAYPYGDVSAGPKAVVGQRVDLGRALHEGVVRKGVDLAQAPAATMDGDRDGSASLARLEAAARLGGWLILFGHQVTREPGEFATHPEALDRLAAAAVRLGLEAVTVAEGARRLQG